MKRVLLVALFAALSTFASSCGKRQTQAERDAEIERQVRQRLEAEHQAEAQQKLAQQQAELAARERALKEKEALATPVPTATMMPPTAESRPPLEATTYATFYRKLEAYGDWIETSSYGYVWQPRQAVQTRSWRPYSNGHWVYTDAGWTWISDEPFGWATYHYGRWIRLRGTGWVWVPGQEWGPAWVSWRQGNDYIGWAPLPPEAHFDRQTGIQNWADSYYDIGPEQYTFISPNEFGSQLTSRQLVPTARNLTIIHQTTNVTNITYNNSTVVNGGPSYDELRTRSRQPIAQLRLERTQNPDDEGAVIRGEVVAMAAPEIRAAERLAPPERVARMISQPVVDRGWGGIKNVQAAEKARAKMRSEATPPSAPPKPFVRQNVLAPAASAANPTAAPATANVSARPTVRPLSGTTSPPPIGASSKLDRLRRKAERREAQNLTPEQKEEKHLLDQQQRRDQKRRILLEREAQKSAAQPTVTVTPSPTPTPSASASAPITISPSAPVTPSPMSAARPLPTASSTPTPP